MPIWSPPQKMLDLFSPLAIIREQENHLKYEFKAVLSHDEI